MASVGSMSTHVAATSRSTEGAWRFIPAAAYVVTILGILLGNGVFGGAESVGQEDSIAGTPTLITPAGPAFSIWGVIYGFLVGYVVWQALAPGARTPRMRALLWPAVASLLLNAAWIYVVQVIGSAWGSVAVIVALLGSLIVIHRILRATPPSSTLERWLVDVGFGLYLGWVTIATTANISFALVLSGVPTAAVGSVIATVVVLLVVLGVAAFVLPRVTEPLAVAAAMAWGLSWIAVDRFTSPPEQALVGAAAIVVALAIAAYGVKQQLSSRS